MLPADKPFLIFTGGHHTGALAVAEALKKEGWGIVWIGHRRSLWRDRSDSAEYREVISAGIPFYNLKAGKIYRTYHPLKLLRFPRGFIGAFYIILSLKLKLKSDLKGIVTFGGYLGAPVVFCGWLLGLPAIAHEQTMTAGWGNKFISLFAKKIAISWPGSARYYPGSKVVYTGLPLRPEIIAVRKNQTDKKRIPGLIYITGGKQGSHVINVAVMAALGDLLEKYTLVHQTGSSTQFMDYQRALDLRRKLDKKRQSRYRVCEYLSSREAAGLLSTAEVVVARSGAHIVQELAYLGCRCVLIPIPWSSHNEQFQNARLLASGRLAVILSEEDLNAKSLTEAISRARKLKPGKISVPEKGLENMIGLIDRELINP
jgi:UDP-N-acetylglucosamine--N-acetylmuramyl-(pentapeptide) pyrophosphoryl-undecaprenol N-acetylglucosamine transferase